MSATEILIKASMVAFFLGVLKLFHWIANRKENHFIKSGKESVAKVIKVTDTQIEYSAYSSEYRKLIEIQLEVKTNEGKANYVIAKQPYNDLKDIPQVGDSVTILIDPKNLKEAYIKSSNVE